MRVIRRFAAPRNYFIIVILLTVLCLFELNYIREGKLNVWTLPQRQMLSTRADQSSRSDEVVRTKLEEYPVILISDKTIDVYVANQDKRGDMKENDAVAFNDTESLTESQENREVKREEYLEKDYDRYVLEQRESENGSDISGKGNFSKPERFQDADGYRDIDYLVKTRGKTDNKTHKRKEENFDAQLDVPKQNNSNDRRERIMRAHFGNPLDFIPEVWEMHGRMPVPYIKDNITAEYLRLPKIKYTYKIVILTPIRNSEHALKRYARMIYTLKYPHNLISVYFGENDSKDRTVEVAQFTAHMLKSQGGFKDADIFKLNITGGIQGSKTLRHQGRFQHDRRAHLALARNVLLESAMKRGNFDYALWIDSDVAEVTKDLIEQMLYADSDVVATSCLVKLRGYKFRYDLNSWQETPASIQYQRKLPPDFLLLEGYFWTGRVYLPDLRSKGRVVHLDGVGGCALLVRYKCHRSGLRFPDFVYQHQIETEGLARMASTMGYTVVGLPFVEVYHE